MRTLSSNRSENSDLSGRNNRNEAIVLFDEVATVRELAAAIAKQVYPADRRAPTNLDGLVDMLREYKVKRIISSYWSMSPKDTDLVERVFEDEGIELIK
ncbi:hypothetical protein GCM10027157_14900 [Corynebacterium aquatimens]